MLGLSRLADAAARSPNVILILADDQGYGDMACHGHPCLKTPALDALHGDSVRLKNFHVDPTCAPTRAALMTGKYASRVGVWHTLQGRSILRREETTMAELFRDGGYRTGIFGKWHLGDNFPYRPQDRGFQEVVIHGGAGVGQNPDYWGNTYFDDQFCRNGGWEKFDGYCTDIWFREATRFIEKNRATPFLCYLPLNAPHFPYRVPEGYQKPYLALGMDPELARYLGMIACIDENVGRLRHRLSELGIEDNTVLLYMSDNGYGGPKRTAASAPFSNIAGMRGMKGTQYEGGHRVPCFIHWPAGNLVGGRDIPQLTAHFDLLPTLLELCGLPQQKNSALDGRSLVPLLRQQTADWPDRTLFVHNPRMETPKKWHNCAVMTERWRLIDGKALYDLQADPGQKRDLAASQPETVRQLRAEYEKWWASLAPRFAEACCLSIGAPQENPVKLTCHDWHSEGVLTTWDQSVIASRRQDNGWWTLQVERAGTYTFRMQDLPDEAKADKTMQAVRARMKIGGVDLQQDIPPEATSVQFTADLPAGPARMDTWLIEANGDSRGAPFVYVEWKGAVKH
jgi:arylsulfatase A-like enzyme